MQLSFITPTAYIPRFQSQGDFILALSHLIDLDKENEYEQAIKATGLPIWMDNGLFENGIPEGMDNIAIKAKKINAELLVAPDTLYSKKSTERGIGNMKYIMDRHSVDCKIMAVVQAKTKKEFLEFYQELCENDLVDVIGLSILAIPYVYKDSPTNARVAFMQDCLKMDIKHKAAHLLGLGDSLADVLFAKNNCPWIKSHDSSSAFWNAIQLKAIDENGRIEGGKTHVRVNFDYNDADKKQLDLAQQNINTYKKLLK